jgi:hypothetical protein
VSDAATLKGTRLNGDDLHVTPKQYDDLRRELDAPRGWGRGEVVIMGWLQMLGLDYRDFMHRQTHIVVDWNRQ